MKNIFCVTLKVIILLLICSVSQFSVAGQYPVITSVSAIMTDPTHAEYRYSAQLAEIGSASETTMVPGNYTTGVVFKEVSNVGEYPMFVGTKLFNGDYTAQPIGPLAVTAFNGDVRTGKLSFTVDTYHIPGEGKRCLAYLATVDGINSWSNIINPVGCTYVPAPSELCKITTPQILLDHGSITLKDAEGNVAKSNVGVSCTNAMAVTFHLTTNSPYINLSPSGKSEIKIENQPLGSTINLPAGTKMLSISDMLTGVSTEGVNAGSSVLVMEPY